MTIWKLLYKKAHQAGYSQGFSDGKFWGRREVEDEIADEKNKYYDEMDEYYDNQVKEERLEKKNMEDKKQD